MITRKPKPEAYISMGKDRLKVYEGKNVYLQNNQEFSFEMFNATSDNVMARISINGNRISDKGIVLRPGMRGWLDRYLDENRKFLFETYVVGNSKAVEKAIADNGLIKIEFFREKEKPRPTFDMLAKTRTGGNGHGGKKRYKKSICRGIVGTDSLSDESLDFSDEYEASAVATAGIAPQSLSRSMSKSKETGRVEKGGVSDQQFRMVDMEFEYSAFHTVEYKLLPESEKKVEINNVKLKCDNCGTKIKQGWKVCPVCASPVDGKCTCGTCGEKLEPVWKACPMCGEPIIQSRY